MFHHTQCDVTHCNRNSSHGGGGERKMSQHTGRQTKILLNSGPEMCYQKRHDVCAKKIRGLVVLWGLSPSIQATSRSYSPSYTQSIFYTTWNFHLVNMEIGEKYCIKSPEQVISWNLFNIMRLWNDRSGKEDPVESVSQAKWRISCRSHVHPSTTNKAQSIMLCNLVSATGRIKFYNLKI